MNKRKNVEGNEPRRPKMQKSFSQQNESQMQKGAIHLYYLSPLPKKRTVNRKLVQSTHKCKCCVVVVMIISIESLQRLKDCEWHRTTPTNWYDGKQKIATLLLQVMSEQKHSKECDESERKGHIVPFNGSLTCKLQTLDHEPLTEEDKEREREHERIASKIATAPHIIIIISFVFDA